MIKYLSPGSLPSLRISRLKTRLSSKRVRLTTDTKPIRVLLIDDHAAVRSLLRILIESQLGLKVIGEAGNRADALAIAARKQPDIILLDLDLGRDSGLDFLPELFTAAKDARVLVLTGVRDPGAHARAVRLGAMGLVMKEEAAEVVIKAIEKVHAGEVWLDRSTAAKVLTEITRAPEAKKSDPPTEAKESDPEVVKIATLTEREREVIALIGEGLKNKQIATRLQISETTVRHHLTSVFGKLGVSDRLELVIYAYRNSLAKL
jgi:two-component system nitrate/nitrite response regulator NarL